MYAELERQKSYIESTHNVLSNHPEIRDFSTFDAYLNNINLIEERFDVYENGIKLDIENVSDVIFDLNKSFSCSNIFFVTNEIYCPDKRNIQTMS